ncbi:copper fist DNA binding domain-containing protein [Fennellomyces sp. T-0311]|nr:copper fist DNA binding domain-containing protein [Fennellomyces sp. T-0311]
MPIINGIKFACNSCIKGHRSSHCNHVERPLFEIRRKGRPVTQCAYCRDLRKTKQVHVKCVCSERRVEASNSNSHNAPAVTISLPQGMTGQRQNPGPAEPNRFLETRAPDCPTSNAQNDDSFSWAWIRPNNVGYVFQKPQPISPAPVAAVTAPSPTLMDLDAVVAQMTETNAVSIGMLSSPPPPPPTPRPTAPPPAPPAVVSCCGSFASSSACQPSSGQSESVVITITPLPKQQDDQVTTTTRVVTCYCGPACVCPGCLVHPANAFLDPYAGLYPMQQQSSSSASSTCGSDDD